MGDERWEPLEETLVERSEDGTILPKTEAPRTGDRELIAALPRVAMSGSIHDLQLGQTIGQGGMGIVRDAEQLAIGRHVAVKTLRPEKNDPTFALILLREAWVTGALEHPNVIPVYSVGIDKSGSPMIVMKRVEGTPWSADVNDPSRDLRWHLKIFVQVCNAIDFAGSRGIIHRDLKPDNVMIGSFGEVYVVDWGIAVSVSDDRGGRLPLVSDVRGISGTPAYMAPEMVRQRGDQLSIRTDVYLLGAILHELMTKEKRHGGKDLQVSLFSASHSTQFIYEPHLPFELTEIANRAMHKLPEHRYATAGELRAAIEKFLEHESSRELTDQADQRLETWEKLPQAEALAVQSLFGEARFAFQQALREWPENTRAKRGLEICLERKFEHDLSRDDLESASLMLSELGARPELAERVQTLRARLSLRSEELASLRELGKQRDLKVAQRTRAGMVLAAGFVWSSPLVLAALLGVHGDAGYPFFIAVTVMKLALSLGLLYAARDVLFKNEINRQLVFAVVVLLGTELALRVFGMKLGTVPLEQLVFVDYCAYFLVSAMAARTIDHRLKWNAAGYAGFAILSGIWPAQLYWFLAAAHLASGLLGAMAWRSDYKRVT